MIQYSGIAAHISWAANQHKTPAAIAALRIAFFINFEPDARMAQRCAARYITGPVTADSALMGAYSLRIVTHISQLATAGERFNWKTSANVIMLFSTRLRAKNSTKNPPS